MERMVGDTTKVLAGVIYVGLPTQQVAYQTTFLWSYALLGERHPSKGVGGTDGKVGQ